MPNSNNRYDLESFAVGFQAATDDVKFEYLVADVECALRRTTEGEIIGVCDCGTRVLVVGEDKVVLLADWLIHKAFCDYVQ